MLLRYDFIDYANKLDKKTNDILPFCIEMHKKYPQLQKKLEDIARANFTTNGSEDYEVIPLNPPIQQPFYDMLRLVQLKHLFPNFFSEQNKELVKKTANPNDTHPQATALISLLLWHDFDEQQYLSNKKEVENEIEKTKKTEQIKRNKENYRTFTNKTNLKKNCIKTRLSKEK